MARPRGGAGAPRAGQANRSGLCTRPAPAPSPPPPAGGYGGGAPGGDGFTFLDTLASLDTETGAVTRLAPSGRPPTRRAYHSWSVAGGLCYVFGGRCQGGMVEDCDPTLLCAYDPAQVRP